MKGKIKEECSGSVKRSSKSEVLPRVVHEEAPISSMMQGYGVAAHYLRYNRMKNEHLKKICGSTICFNSLTLYY